MSLPKPTVTIFADASRHVETGESGWGAWIKADGRASMTCGAKMKEPTTGSDQAELFALINALTVARLTGAVQPEAVVMLQSDSVVALSMIRAVLAAAIDAPADGGLRVGKSRRYYRRKSFTAGLDMLKAIVAEMRLTILVRHVKGHTSGGGRNWVNRRTDSIAKDARYGLRKTVLDSRGGATV